MHATIHLLAALVMISKLRPNTLFVIASKVKWFVSREKFTAEDHAAFSFGAIELQYSLVFFSKLPSIALIAVVVKACAMFRLLRLCSAGSSMDTTFSFSKR